MATCVTAEFERLVRAFLADRPFVLHEWRRVASRLWGDRSDLVFPSAEPGGNEVFATLYDDDSQVTVGINDHHRTFEEFGRGLSEEEVAAEAFAYLLRLLDGRDTWRPLTISD
jgi:hypothetical protein